MLLTCAAAIVVSVTLTRAAPPTDSIVATIDTPQQQNASSLTEAQMCADVGGCYTAQGSPSQCRVFPNASSLRFYTRCSVECTALSECELGYHRVVSGGDDQAIASNASHLITNTSVQHCSQLNITSSPFFSCMDGWCTNASSRQWITQVNLLNQSRIGAIRLAPEGSLSRLALIFAYAADPCGDWQWVTEQKATDRNLTVFIEPNATWRKVLIYLPRAVLARHFRVFAVQDEIAGASSSAVICLRVQVYTVPCESELLGSAADDAERRHGANLALFIAIVLVSAVLTGSGGMWLKRYLNRKEWESLQRQRRSTQSYALYQLANSLTQYTDLPPSQSENQDL